MRISLLAQARILLLTACYVFLILPSLPVWAQKPPSSSEAPSHTITERDTLWDIAARELGDPLLWPKLWMNNPSVVNPDVIFPGNDILLKPEPIPFAAPEAPPPVEEVIPEAPPPMEEVTPELPPVVEEPLFETPPPAEEPKPWYKKWWVWTVAGTVIAGVVTAIAINNRDDEDATGSVTIVAPEP